MLTAFDDLGDTIARIWEGHNYDEEVFADVATKALIESRILETVDPADIVDWLVSSQRIPEQKYREFGQPPINLYIGKNFLIEVLFWLDSTTAIHQHAFAGAFGVLAGSSVHSQYQFEQRQSVSEQLMLGDVNFMSSELLKRGDVRTIHIGNKFIHALFHLDRPSLSVVVRTKSLSHHKPQYSYLKPWMAVDPFYKPEPFMTQIRVLEALKRTDLKLYWQTAQTLVSNGDLWMSYIVLSSAHRKFHESDEWESLLRLARWRYGEQVEYLVPCLEEQDREIKIIARRESVHEADYRFFLALLLNVPKQSIIYKLILNRFPDTDPESLVLRWIKELSEKKLLGLEFNAISLQLLQSAMRGAHFDAAKASLIRTFSLSQSVEQDDKLKALWEEIRNAKMLRPLLQP